MVVRLFLLLAFVCQSRGQTAFYDIGNGIFEGNTERVVADSESRKFCYSGTTLYYVDVDVNPSQIRSLSGTTEAVERTVTGATIDSLSCGCSTLAFTYQLGGRTILEYRNVDDDDVFIKLDLGAATTTAIRLQIELGKLIVVSNTGFWKFDLNVEDGASFTNFDTALSNTPKCVAAYRDGSVWYLFISFDYREGIVVVCIAADGSISNQETLQVQRPDGGNARVACLDVDGDEIYFLHESSGTVIEWEVNGYPVEDWFESPAPIYSDADRDPIISGGNEDFDDCVNGLDICGAGTGCGIACDDGCDCTGDCGFCAAGDDTCQCENSVPDFCCYESSTLSEDCISLLPPINAMCVIKNPRAQRRKFDEVQVLGVSQEEATITVERRTVSTGRWGISELPPRDPITETSPLWINGFSAETQTSARGKRFGVFLADINPTAVGELTARINCIVTEASKFINKFYTYCGHRTGSVTLEATGLPGSQVNMHLDEIRWLFTPVDLVTVTVGTPTTPNCAASSNVLTCTLNDLSMDDEGIYEVYRAGRYLKTWHPIFSLSVRACPENRFGSTCTMTCTPLCVHGKCDPSGDCVCYPGWTGPDCNTPCSDANTVGQGCDITCTDICPGATDCKDLLFCLPGKLGCLCRSGLRSPQCWQPCEEDTWGENCQLDCDGCNPRTGMVL